MPLCDAVFQDGHHHALAGVASPPGPGDVERRRAVAGAVPALLRTKEREVHVSWESGISRAPFGKNRLTETQSPLSIESSWCGAQGRAGVWILVLVE